MGNSLKWIGAAVAFCSVSSLANADDIKIGYVNKMGDHPWFVAEVVGAQKAAEARGASLIAQDVQFNADLAITAVDTMIGDGVKGIAIVVPDRGIGPVVAARAKEAGVKLVAVDDDIYHEDGTKVPFVGLDSYNIGLAVGEELSNLYKASGWDPETVKIASIEDRKADTCMLRNKGAEDAFLKANPEFERDDIARVAYDNTMVNSIDVMTTTLTANPQITNWIFYSCNDDGVLGAARAMENSGYAAENGIGVGIDGSRACDAFGNGRASAFKGTMWFNPENQGKVAVNLLMDAIENGKDLPENTYSSPELVNMGNFDAYKGRLCK
ncbi:L-arabinose transport system substrate-binding protein [Cohaesibacter marisflavi]|uniref:L-arabinose transport system substrate-binding protein n=1 Tax=Cohaesibacter marisflavi TaxID=655353 RepID=A0A1I5KLG3_9HYPH|nr:substrate-binding domain-containing protein [Cohaesibacter marisflavi]SFO85727.1 L-arabinose transport system substrate-binding protein [Cohaesibacter marisflavi]